MTRRNNTRYICGHRIIALVVLCLFGLCAVWSVRPNRKKVRKADDERVYLVHSDRLFFDAYKNADAQILNGNVEFRHKGARLLCDSAHFYEGTNSFEAWGHVRMFQADTLSLFSDYAYYDGDEQMAEARYNVVMKNRKTTLYTDSLNYDRLYGLAYFFEGGKMVDGTAVLTADWGEYDTELKEARFNYNVRLKDDNFFLVSDTLLYDTNTKEAHTTGPSHITSGKSKIFTQDGYYNTNTKTSKLYDRSVLNDDDKTLVGDSVFYNEKDSTGEAFGNVVYTDKTNKNMMKSDYCWYDGRIGYAMATKRALVIDYSQHDSLYMHADTFKLYTININTDSVYRKIHAYNKVRAYRMDVQAVCDSLVYNSLDSCMTMYRDPIVWNNNQQLLGEEIRVYMNDSTISRAHVLRQALSVEQMPDTVHFNQVASIDMFAYFNNGEIREAEAVDNVVAAYYVVDDADSTIIGLNRMETSRMKIFLENRKMSKIWTPQVEGVMYPISQVPADKKFLPTFAWFDYVRPLNKDDIFNWRPKKSGSELKEVKRKAAPLPTLN